MGSLVLFLTVFDGQYFADQETYFTLFPSQFDLTVPHKLCDL